ncbi:hypothetical protein [Moraxella lacunata]|uniref:hypothetical protein n=1 Tax=Moraxella lacunata TaxID=477 RepID=UPI003EE0EF15
MTKRSFILTKLPQMHNGILSAFSCCFNHCHLLVLFLIIMPQLIIFPTKSPVFVLYSYLSLPMYGTGHKG